MKEQMQVHDELMEPAPVKTYNVKELMGLYGSSRYTINLWLDGLARELGERKGRILTIRQVKIIFEEYGHPLVPKKKKEDDKGLKKFA